MKNGTGTMPCGPERDPGKNCTDRPTGLVGWRAVNFRLFSLYLGFALIIPAITIIVEYFVTINPLFRTSLMVDLQDFHVYQLFTSSFVHVNFDHFVGNVTAYLVIIIYGLVLATLLNKKRLYLVLTKIIVGVFILFGAVFALFNLTTTYYAGLSGIDAALAGLLFLFWLMYLEQRSGQSMRNYYGVVLAAILALSAGITARYMFLYHTPRISPLLTVLAILVLCLLVSLVVCRSQFVTVYRELSKFSWPSRAMTVAIVAILAYFIWNIFPERLGPATRSASITLHLCGVILGVAAGYVFMVYLVRIGYFHTEKEVIRS